MERKENKQSIIGRWPEIPYAGEKKLPIPEEPTAGSWPTYYLKRDEKGGFLDPKGRPINLKIKNPKSIDFTGKQLKIVQKTLNNITKEKIKIADYWGTGPATKQWTPILDKLIDVYNITAPRAGRMLGAVQAGLNDAFVVTWYYKYLWAIPRPNQLDQKLATVLCTPKHPSYPSGHSVVAGCAQVIISYFFPPKSKIMRRFAEECSISRLYAGVHYPVDNDEGFRLGKQIGKIIVADLKRQKDSTHTRIDRYIKTNKKVKLPPPPYEQVLPFLGETKCRSLLIDRNIDRKKSKGKYQLFLLFLLLLLFLSNDS